MLPSPMPAPPAVPPAPEPDVLNLASWRLTPVKLPYQRVVRWSDTVEDGGTYLLLELLSSFLESIGSLPSKTDIARDRART